VKGKVENQDPSRAGNGWLNRTRKGEVLIYVRQRIEAIERELKIIDDKFLRLNERLRELKVREI